MSINSIPTKRVSQHSWTKHTGEKKILASALARVWFSDFGFYHFGCRFEWPTSVFSAKNSADQQESFQRLKASTQSFFMRFLFFPPQTTQLEVCTQCQQEQHPTMSIVSSKRKTIFQDLVVSKTKEQYYTNRVCFLLEESRINELIRFGPKCRALKKQRRVETAGHSSRETRGSAWLGHNVQLNSGTSSI